MSRESRPTFAARTANFQRTRFTGRKRSHSGPVNLGKRLRDLEKVARSTVWKHDGHTVANFNIKKTTPHAYTLMKTASGPNETQRDGDHVYLQNGVVSFILKWPASITAIANLVNPEHPVRVIIGVYLTDCPLEGTQAEGTAFAANILPLLFPSATPEPWHLMNTRTDNEKRSHFWILKDRMYKRPSSAQVNEQGGVNIIDHGSISQHKLTWSAKNYEATFDGGSNDRPKRGCPFVLFFTGMPNTDGHDGVNIEFQDRMVFTEAKRPRKL